MSEVIWDAESTDLLPVLVTAPVDPLTFDIDIAIVPNRTPVDANTVWLPAQWTAGQTWQAGHDVEAQLLIGPLGGAVTLERWRHYDVYAQIAANTVHPVQLAGTLLTR